MADEYISKTKLRNALYEADAITMRGAQIINDFPAADVVPVVRCKDCKWWKLSDYNTLGIHICQRFSGVRGEHDFCSRGERMDLEN